MNCCRELTLEEEIDRIEDSALCDRLLRKYREEKEYEKILERHLENCHNKIKRLERAIVVQANLMASVIDGDDSE